MLLPLTSAVIVTFTVTVDPHVKEHFHKTIFFLAQKVENLPQPECSVGNGLRVGRCLALTRPFSSRHKMVGLSQMFLLTLQVNNTLKYISENI